MQLLEIPKVRAEVDRANRDYAAKRDAAAAAMKEAEATAFNIKDATPFNLKGGDDASKTERRWAEALRTRKEACGAAVAAMEKMQRLVDVSATGAAKVGGALSDPRVAQVAGVVASAVPKDKAGVGEAMTREAKKATEELALRILDVAKEKQEEIVLLQKVRADAMLENALKGRLDLANYAQTLQDDISKMMQEVNALREKAAEVQRRAAEALVEQGNALSQTNGKNMLGQQKDKSLKKCCNVM